MTAQSDDRVKALEEAAFRLGDRVRKIKGSSWQGIVVGTYSTSLTPEGYAVESEREPGSVQIYPASALAPVHTPDTAQGGVTPLRKEVAAVINDMARMMPNSTEDWRARLTEALA